MRIFLFLYHLDCLCSVRGVLFRLFRYRWSQLQLYLAVQCGKLGFQSFQFVLLLPHLAGYLLQLRNFFFQHLVLRLVLVNDRGYLLQRVQEIACGSNRVSHRQMPVIVGVLVVSFNHETVVGELQSLFERSFADHLDGEAVKFPDLLVQSACSGVLCNLLQTLSDNLLVGGIHTIHSERIQAVAILVCLDGGKEPVPVFRHGFNGSRVATKLLGLGLQLELRIVLALVERLAFPFKRCDAFLQFRLVEQVGVTGEQRHVLREIHARFLVHCPLVDGTGAHRPAFQLRDEGLLAVQQVELVRVQRLFHRIDDDIHIVPGKMLGYLVARPDTPSVTLLQVGRAPRRI